MLTIEPLVAIQFEDGRPGIPTLSLWKGSVKIMNSLYKRSVAGIGLVLTLSAVQMAHAQRLLDPRPAPIAENRAREVENRARDHTHRPVHRDARVVHVEPVHYHSHRGYWHHGFRDGRWGWWWVVGPTWTYYARPVYPEPTRVIVQQAVPTVVLPPQPVASAPTVTSAPQYWYYCEPTQTYYPYVSTCSAPWTPVPATPPDTPQ